MEFGALDILGYIGGIVIGLSLGLMGGGGSILTVPVLVYLLGVNPVLGTAYSLFVVGATSLIGAGRFMQQGLVSYKTAIVFILPSLTAVYLTRSYLIPAIPEQLFTLWGVEVTKNIAIMVFFALIMIAASVSMIRSGGKPEAQGPIQYNYPMILLEGAVVGLATGIVGAGGGFLIVPALVILARLPMKLAVGTSLLIIAVKSLGGFVGDIQERGDAIDWRFLLLFTAFTIVGILLGNALAKKVSGAKLKTAFGWFVLLMGIFILTRELFFQGS